MSETLWNRLLEIQRANVTERTIFGAVAVATSTAKLADLGHDPIIFGRSLTKPYQMKVIQKELADVLDWQEKAISLSSHNGNAAQVKVAKQILLPDEWKDLALPPAAPMGGHTAEKSIWTNPCSGKHSAVLRACHLNGWSTEKYLEVDHPYNQAYVKLLEKKLGRSLTDRVVAPDGCGLPTFSISVSELAQLFAALAKDKDEDWIWEAYHRHPELIGGEGRLDTRLLRFVNILAKEGADGLLGIAIADPKYPDGLGIVIKLAHGYDAGILGELAHRVLQQFGIETGTAATFPGQNVMANLNLKI